MAHPGALGTANACVPVAPDTPSCAAHRQGSTVGTTAGRGLAARIPLREERFRVRPLAQAARTGAHCLLRPGDCTSVSRSRASRLAAGHTTTPFARPLSGRVRPGRFPSFPYRPLWHAPGPPSRVVQGGSRSARSEYPAVVLDKEETRGRPQAVGDAPSISAGDERNGTPSDGVATRSIDRAHGHDLPERLERAFSGEFARS